MRLIEREYRRAAGSYFWNATGFEGNLDPDDRHDPRPLCNDWIHKLWHIPKNRHVITLAFYDDPGPDRWEVTVSPPMFNNTEFRSRLPVVSICVVGTEAFRYAKGGDIALLANEGEIRTLYLQCEYY